MIPETNELRFEVATVCNYNCIICSRDKFRRKRQIMETEKFRYYLEKILDETEQFQHLVFPGFGEPTLDRELIKKAVIAKNKGLNLFLLTNGSRISVELFKELEEIGFESVRFSFYGNSLEVYNKMHGLNGSSYFEKVKRELTEICKIKRRTKIIMTYNVVKKVNDQEMQEWIKYWEPLADLLEVWSPHNWVYGRNYRSVQPEKKKTCGRPFHTPIQIQVDGTINMCCFDFNGDLILGDLNKQSLSEIFESEMFRKILKCHQSGNFEGSNLICDNCDQRNEDKSDVLIYDSEFDIKDRIKRVSTTYSSLDD